MKIKFNKKWKASKQPRKQRKYRANAPSHIKHKFLSATLSKELRQKYKTRNLELRKGDEVIIMRGKSRKKQGKIGMVNTKKTKVAVEGVQRLKKDGTKINIMLHPSNLKIISLNLDDKKRLKRLKKVEEADKEKSKEMEEKKNALKKK